MAGGMLSIALPPFLVSLCLPPRSVIPRKPPKKETPLGLAAEISDAHRN